MPQKSLDLEVNWKVCKMGGEKLNLSRDICIWNSLSCEWIQDRMSWLRQWEREVSGMKWGERERWGFWEVQIRQEVVLSNSISLEGILLWGKETEKQKRPQDILGLRVWGYVSQPCLLSAWNYPTWSVERETQGDREVIVWVWQWFCEAPQFYLQHNPIGVSLALYTLAFYPSYRRLPRGNISQVQEECAWILCVSSSWGG